MCCFNLIFKTKTIFLSHWHVSALSVQVANLSNYIFLYPSLAQFPWDQWSTRVPFSWQTVEDFPSMLDQGLHTVMGKCAQSGWTCKQKGLCEMEGRTTQPWGVLFVANTPKIEREDGECLWTWTWKVQSETFRALISFWMEGRGTTKTMVTVVFFFTVEDHMELAWTIQFKLVLVQFWKKKYLWENCIQSQLVVIRLLSQVLNGRTKYFAINVVIYQQITFWNNQILHIPFFPPQLFKYFWQNWSSFYCCNPTITFWLGPPHPSFQNQHNMLIWKTFPLYQFALFVFSGYWSNLLRKVTPGKVLF